MDGKSADEKVLNIVSNHQGSANRNHNKTLRHTSQQGWDQEACLGAPVRTRSDRDTRRHWRGREPRHLGKPFGGVFKGEHAPAVLSSHSAAGCSPKSKHIVHTKTRMFMRLSPQWLSAGNHTNARRKANR